MESFTQNKKLGFKVTLFTLVLSLVSSLVYFFIYSSSRYMSWQAFGIMLGGIVLSILLIALKLYRYAPSMLLVGNFLAFLFFAYYIYFYVSSVVTGIQFSGFPMSFFVNLTMFLLSLLFSIVAVFMPQTEQD